VNKQFIISVVVLFVWTTLVGFLVHALLLGQEYAALPNLFRAEEQAQEYFPFMLAGHVTMAIGLTWIYRMGKDENPWLQQGLRFGVAVALLTAVSTYLIYFATQPMPAALVHKQLVFGSIAVVLTGVVTAFLNKEG
jgi:hypothetical protein